MTGSACRIKHLHMSVSLSAKEWGPIFFKHKRKLHQQEYLYDPRTKDSVTFDPCPLQSGFIVCFCQNDCEENYNLVYVL